MRVDSIAQLPESVRAKVAGKMIAGKRSKYGNRKVDVDGIRFDSAKEARRYVELKNLWHSRKIFDLRLQQDFTLQEAFTNADGLRVRAIRYRADFTYTMPDGRLVIEDVKGMQTQEYRMKKKMMEEKGYHITEV